MAIWFFEQWKWLQNLKAEKSEAELALLRTQINPHFFFNTLNNLYALTVKNSKQAPEVILKLSDMMRYTIYEGEKESVALKDEIAYLKNYIELHKMRYHKEIDVTFEVQIEDDYKVMPLLFVILLENAFKHGVENLSKDAYVHININTRDRDVFFEIENNFDPTLPKEDKGIGLKNLKRRLELVYPNKHSLSFSTIENVYKAQLTLQI
jgi:LytS/YehU family sensor histidine kinase